MPRMLTAAYGEPANLAMESGRQNMAARRTGLQSAPLWIFIPVIMIACLAGWLAASMAINLIGGHPAAYQLFSSIYFAIGVAGVVTVIQVARRGRRR